MKNQLFILACVAILLSSCSSEPVTQDEHKRQEVGDGVLQIEQSFQEDLPGDVRFEQRENRQENSAESRNIGRFHEEGSVASKLSRRVGDAYALSLPPKRVAKAQIAAATQNTHPAPAGRRNVKNKKLKRKSAL